MMNIDPQLLAKYMEIVNKHARTLVERMTIPAFTLAYADARKQGKRPEEAVKHASKQTGIDKERGWEIAEDLEAFHGEIVASLQEGGN